MSGGDAGAEPLDGLSGPEVQIASKARFQAGPYGVVVILMAATVLSFLDRTILGLIVDPIRHDLRIGDAQIGLLSGFAFALFYAFLGLPFGRWADRHNRQSLIVFGVAMWSVATAACGLAHTFTSLFVARVFVGVGEAALGPAALSLVANLFPKHKLGFALALLATGITLGNGFSVTLGGALVAWTETKSVVLPFIGLLSGWRLVFLAVGASGLPLAALIALLVREPPRQTSAAAPSLSAVFAHMYAHAKTYILIISGYSFMVVMSFAQIIWGPTFFLRVLHMTLVSFAVYYGLLMGVGGTLGLIAGGKISDYLTRRGVPGAPARVNLTAIIVQTPFLIVGYLSRDLAMALLCFGVGVIVLTFTGGLQSATLQRITPPRMLGSVSAIYLIFANLVGGGAGPFFIGALSQHLGASGNGLGQSLAVTSIITLPIAAWLVLWALKPLAQSERAVEIAADKLPLEGRLLPADAPTGAFVGDIA